MKGQENKDLAFYVPFVWQCNGDNGSRSWTSLLNLTKWTTDLQTTRVEQSARQTTKEEEGECTGSGRFWLDEVGLCFT